MSHSAGPAATRSSEGESAGRRLLSAASQHLALLTTLLTASIVGVRVMAAAGWSPTTATILLSTQRAPNIVAGTLIGLLPMLPLIAATTYTVVLPRRRLKERGSRTTYGSLLVVAAICMPLGLVLFLVAMSGAMVSSMVLMQKFQAQQRSEEGRPPRKKRDPEAKRRFSLTVMALGLVPYMAFDSRVWVPAELIESAGEPAVVGYVLAEPGDELVVLRNFPRIVERLPADDVDRSYCSAQVSGNDFVRTLAERSVISHLFPYATYPACPVG